MKSHACAPIMRKSHAHDSHKKWPKHKEPDKTGDYNMEETMQTHMLPEMGVTSADLKALAYAIESAEDGVEANYVGDNGVLFVSRYQRIGIMDIIQVSDVDSFEGQQKLMEVQYLPEV